MVTGSDGEQDGRGDTRGEPAKEARGRGGTVRGLIAGMKKLVIFGLLVIGTGFVLSMTSCAGLKVSFETELDANAGNLLNLFN